MVHTELLALLSLLYVCLAVVAHRGSREAGSQAFAAGLLGIAIWLLGGAVEVGAETLGHVLAGMWITYLGNVAVPVAFLVFALQFAGRFAPRAREIILLSLVPAATVMLVWTNAWHELMWAHPPATFDSTEGWVLTPEWGLWFKWIHVPYSYALIASALLILVRELNSPLYRTQVSTFLIGGAIPLITNFLYLLGFAPRVTHLALGVSGFVFTWGFFRTRLFRLTPVAYRSVFETLRDGVIVLDRDDRVVELNPVAASMLVGRRDDALGRPVGQLLPTQSPLLPLLRRGTEVEEVVEGMEGRMEEVTISPVRGPRGEHRGRMILLRDVTAKLNAERALMESQELVRTLVDQSPAGILRLRPEGGDFQILVANPEAGRILGRETTRIVGSFMAQEGGAAWEPLVAGLRDASRGSGMAELELPFRGRWFRVEVAPVGLDLSVTFVDISDRKAREREMEKAARRDPLTGLLNRRGLEARADEILLPGAGSRRACSLLYLDLDNFKPVNDTLGHEAGDLLLKELADRIRSLLRAPDLAARMGGDEFAILLPGVDGEAAQRVAERLREELEQPYVLDGTPVVCPASVGIAVQPEHGQTLTSLLNAADAAMYRAKREATRVSFPALD